MGIESLSRVSLTLIDMGNADCSFSDSRKESLRNVIRYGGVFILVVMSTYGLLGAVVYSCEYWVRWESLPILIYLLWSAKLHEPTISPTLTTLSPSDMCTVLP